MRILLWLIAMLAGGFVGGVAGLLLLASMFPGVKGPHITDDQAVTSFVVGAVLGGLGPLAVYLWRRRAR